MRTSGEKINFRIYFWNVRTLKFDEMKTEKQRQWMLDISCQDRSLEGIISVEAFPTWSQSNRMSKVNIQIQISFRQVSVALPRASKTLSSTILLLFAVKISHLIFRIVMLLCCASQCAFSHEESYESTHLGWFVGWRGRELGILMRRLHKFLNCGNLRQITL